MLSKSELIKRVNELDDFAPTGDIDQVGSQQISLSNQDLKPAGVLVPIVIGDLDNGTEPHIILTKRASHLKHHPGQVSFPGGRQEETDSDLKATALRETHEEIGIDPKLVSIIGELPKHQTISGYLMTPYIGIVESTYKITLDRSEVDEAFTVPLSFICNESNHEVRSAIYNGQERFYYVIPYQDYYIWGATARVLVEFSKRVINRFDHSTK